MAKRQTKRKVVIRYIGRDPNDPLVLLEAIEEAFRPKDIEIEVSLDSESETDDSQVANEQLETKAREKAAEVLEERETRSQVEKGKHDGSRELIQRKQRLRTWVANKIAAGWRLLVKILPILKQVKDLLE